MSIALVDLDFCKYSVASVGEERYIEVTHKPSGRKREFSDITEFRGRGKVIGGWLGDKNAEREEKCLAILDINDFHIESLRRQKEELSTILHSAKVMVGGVVKASKATEARYYIDGEGNFRDQLATLIEYKGKRKKLEKPLFLDEVSKYLTRKFKPTVVNGMEVDDKLVTECVKLLGEGKDAFIIGVDKDYRTSPIKYYDYNRQGDGIIDCRGFGKIWWDTSKKTAKCLGYGRLFKYWQLLAGDDVDDIKPSHHSDKGLAGKGAFNLLKDVTTDKDAWQVIVTAYKDMYPEPKTVVGWRGDSLKIDWMYCLQENFSLLHLRRFEGDNPQIENILRHFGVAS